MGACTGLAVASNLYTTQNTTIHDTTIQLRDTTIQIKDKKIEIQIYNTNTQTKQFCNCDKTFNTLNVNIII